MALSYQDCLLLVKEDHPGLYPVWWIEKDEQYLFNMLKRGVSKDEATSNFYAVDSKSGGVSSNLPAMEIYGNDTIAEKLAHPHEIDPEDQRPLEHQIALSGGIGWGIHTKADERSLAHYGIKGQKWGIRRFQNEDRTLTPEGKERYYGKTSDSSKSKGESDAKKYDRSVARDVTRSIIEDTNRIYKEHVGDQKPGFFEDMRIMNAARSEAVLNYMEKPTPENLINREKSKQGDPTNKVMKDIARTVLDPINVVFLANDAVKASASVVKEKNYLIKREKNSVFDEKTGFYMKEPGEYDEKQDLAAVNPRVHDLNSNSKNNCMLCTTTYDLRKRGYDVTAQMDSIGYTFGDLKRWYPKAKMERIPKFGDDGKVIKQRDYVRNTINKLTSQGDGARGNLMIFFLGGGGHSVFYEVKNGNLVIKDSQVNKVYKNPERLLNMTTICSYARLDNVEPDLKMIRAECCR